MSVIRQLKAETVVHIGSLKVFMTEYPPDRAFDLGKRIY